MSYIRTEAHKKKMSKIKKKQWQNSASYRKKQIKHLRSIWKNPKHRKFMTKRFSGEKNPMYGNKRFSGKNNPMYGKKGKECPNWKGGRPKCIICGKEVNYGHNRCKSCYNKNMKGPNSPSWKGGKTKDQRGYISKYTPGHPFATNNYVEESRLVVEKFIGRYLLPVEEVHHLGKKSDNRPFMLMAFKNTQSHQKWEHGKDINLNDIIFDGRKLKH